MAFLRLPKEFKIFYFLHLEQRMAVILLRTFLADNIRNRLV